MDPHRSQSAIQPRICRQVTFSYVLMTWHPEYDANGFIYEIKQLT
jgi:hypothetical protein